MLIVLVRGRGDLVGPVLVATAGNFLGACTTFWLARQAARRLTGDTPAGRHHPRAAALLTRFGQPALLLSWVPLVGDAIVVVAGAIGVPFRSFSAWVIAGKAARYAAVAWIAARV